MQKHSNPPNSQAYRPFTRDPGVSNQ
uniref:Uncharacterized protein n=1 Tax=Anguilla anguilla TaxID=7936 RepID=A0A0E9UY81_ANGAN